jgi:DNA-nicking Smr family endonuclease
MKRPLDPDEARLWRAVLSTVRPLAGRELPAAPQMRPKIMPKDALRAAHRTVPAPSGAGQRARAAVSGSPVGPSAVQGIEPNRARRIVVGREPIGARIDLHGMGQDQARAALLAFLQRAQADGQRAALVITGKGVSGDGVLRRRAPEWLAEPALRGVVAGVAHAHPRHGGDGALYVALKRKPPD